MADVLWGTMTAGVAAGVCFIFAAMGFFCSSRFAEIVSRMSLLPRVDRYRRLIEVIAETRRSHSSVRSVRPLWHG
jgi:hypothetical protein